MGTRAAEDLLTAHEAKNAAATARHTTNLARNCTTEWRNYWRQLGG